MPPKATLPSLKKLEMAIIGLGYVGLPLAVAFSRHFNVLGFDLNPERVRELASGIDRRREVELSSLDSAGSLHFSTDPGALAHKDVFIVAVPTPIDEIKRPDLGALKKACELIGKQLKPGNCVIFESTVYPGATEEVAIPILEQVSGFGLNRDFHVGYSPERVNPGDGAHPLTDIVKITSASSPQAHEFVDGLYRLIIRAGTYRAESIRVAEAAKAIENSQRDLNIAFMNELALIFDRLGLDTASVLKAAGTKWNFLPFKPGLVGGHCIGVDPYYLTYKAQQVGYEPEVILAGRRINDHMGRHIAQRVVKLMVRKKIAIPGARVLVQGFTFKENCADIRNTRVADLVDELTSYGLAVDITDPWAHADEMVEYYGLRPVTPEPASYDALILAVAHREFRDQDETHLNRLLKTPHVVFDVQSVLPRTCVDARL
ncbi:MAG: nucleotide sugar dehydrogenase [Gammaproteobacteria bacterium]